MAKRRIVKKKQPLVQLDLLNEIDKQSYTEEQKQFINFSGEESVILSATAGSGKTYSSIQRLKELLSRGVDPAKIIFFSFTKAATEELQNRVGSDEIKITTIHAFCLGVLSKVGKFKKISTFYEFIQWFQEKYKPSPSDDHDTKNFYYETISELYDDADYIASEIAAFKLQSADGLKSKVPNHIHEYRQFLRETKSRDFSDMLIEVRDLFKEDKWLKMFRNKYDYIFVDEYQDTSLCQMSIVLSLNAKHYYLMGDAAQSIYGYSGANCKMVEQMLKERRKTLEMNLSINFRSDIKIVENSNRFSNLKAIANSKEQGFVDDKMILIVDDLIDILKTPDEIAVLVRTNDVIKKLESTLLKRKIPMRYFNFITATDIKNFKKGDINVSLKIKLEKLRKYFNNDQEVIDFIEENKTSNKFITSIHKFKGKEADVCVVVNSVSPEILQKNPNHHRLTKKQLEKITFDPNDESDIENKCIHYVAVSRPRHKLYFMIMIFG